MISKHLQVDFELDNFYEPPVMQAAGLMKGIPQRTEVLLMLEIRLTR